MKKLSDINNVDVQAMQQRYILEEFARKISKSKHKSSINPYLHMKGKVFLI